MAFARSPRRRPLPFTSRDGCPSLLFCLLALLLWQPTLSQSNNSTMTTTEYPVPDFVMRMIVQDDDIDLLQFQDDLDLVTTRHVRNELQRILNATLFQQKLTSVILKSRVLRTYLDDKELMGASSVTLPPNMTERLSLIQTAYSGKVVFDKGTRMQAPWNDTEAALQDLVVYVNRIFAGPSFWTFLRTIHTKPPLLSHVTELRVSVNNTLSFQGTVHDLPPLDTPIEVPHPPITPNKDASSDGNRGQRTGIILAAVICFVATCLIVIFGVLLYQHQSERTARLRRQQNAARRRQSKLQLAATASTEAALESEHEPSHHDDLHPDAPDRDSFLEEWAKQITSIPVRSCSKKKRKKQPPHVPPAPRPARRQSRKNWLGCIAEEDDVIDTSERVDDDFMDDDEEDDSDDIGVFDDDDDNQHGVFINQGTRRRPRLDLEDVDLEDGNNSSPPSALQWSTPIHAQVFERSRHFLDNVVAQTQFSDVDATDLYGQDVPVDEQKQKRRRPVPPPEAFPPSPSSRVLL